MKNDIKPLREAGFALHWLRPRTKRPYAAEWSTAAVATADELLAAYRTGDNLGVRPGEPSRVGNGYLHLFDLDIRIGDLTDECWEAFRGVTGLNPDDFPCVQSGSGGDSRHIFFVTDRPFQSKMIAHSAGKHRGPDGKWHYDWEIELFGTGKQVVLPPSIHPESGKPYRWVRPFDFDMLELGISPDVASSVVESWGAVDSEKFEFEDREPLDFKPGQLERDLDAIDISALHYDDWVRLGQALHHQFGGSQEGFDLWVAQTKRSTKFTGDAQLREMRRIKWRSFGRYRGRPVTMGTVRQWAQEARTAELVDELDDLDDVATSEPQESDDFGDIFGTASGDSVEDAMAALLKETPADALTWVSLLDVTDKGAFVGTLHNLELIMKNDPRLTGLAQINEFTQETVQRTPPGTRGKKRANQAKPTRELTGRVWDISDTLNGELWSEDRDFAIRSVIEAPRTQRGYGFKVSDRDLKAAVVLAANEHAFHPIREYLTDVAGRWDGVKRVEMLWIDYVNACDDRYHRDVARLMMVAAVARIFEPGHKFDYATILEGLQGKRKSTLIEILGKKWFAELDGDWHDHKQLVELMQGAWIMEIPELTGFGRADVRAIKAFISRKKDRVRLAYARRAGEFPRQCIFVGSTNDREYLKDDTGGRRFWPVTCNLGINEEIDTDRLLENVDQLWAEALLIYREMREAQPYGTLPLYLCDPQSRATAARLQESRRVEGPEDVMAGQIAEWLSNPINSGSIDDDIGSDGKPLYRDEVCTAMLWVEMLGKDLASFNVQAQGQVNRAMSKVPGWTADGQMRFNRYGKQRVFRTVSATLNRTREVL